MTWRKIWPWAIGGGVLLLLMFRRGAGVLSRGSQAALMPTGWLTGSFHEQRETHVHQGVDIAAPEGTEVRAASGGTVVAVDPDGVRTGYGNTVIIEHGGMDRGVLTLYAHLSGFGGGISVGRRVEGGDVLGYVGTTAAPNAPVGAHLHFEVLAKKVLYKGAVVVNREEPGRLDPVVWLAGVGRSMVG
jgi:murein DD-endopeptidase MepM/ murein hydrolase activator NlpD